MDDDKREFFPFQDINIIPFGEEVKRLYSFGYSDKEILDSGILSFAVPVDNIIGNNVTEVNVPDGNEVPVEPPLDGIWSKLEEAIRAQVKKDGIKPESIQEGQTEADVLEDAVATIYHDVSEFYAWYFNPDDDRNFILKEQKKVDIPPDLRSVVKSVVDDNLDAMREVDEIPTGQDVPGLDDIITDSLSRYIINWQDWFYDRKREEAIDNYFEQKSFYDDIYREDDYGQLSNLLDENQFDGLSDIPYLTDELNL